ncbi:MAG: hypothetical protein ACOY9J_03945 [Pseudomonadota bacterium]
MNKTLPALLSITFALSLIAMSADASARERKAKSSSHSRTVERSRDGGTASKDVTGTTGDGRTWENHVDITKTDDGYIRTATRTGLNGGTSVREAVGTRTDNGWTKSVTITNTPPQNGDVPSE